MLPMKELSGLLENNSCKNVQTYIQSGNVVFQSTRNPVMKITISIEQKYNFKPEIILLEKMEFLQSVKDNPYSSTNGKDIHFYFCNTTPQPNLKRLEELKVNSEKYSIKARVFYLYAPDGIGKSRLAVNIEKCLAVSATGRNLNTVNKLVEMVQNT